MSSLEVLLIFSESITSAYIDYRFTSTSRRPLWIIICCVFHQSLCMVNYATWRILFKEIKF